MQVASIEDADRGATFLMIVSLVHVVNEQDANKSAGSQSAQDLCKPDALHTPSPASTLRGNSDSRSVKATTAAAVASTTERCLPDEQKIGNRFDHRGLMSRTHSPVFRDEREPSDGIEKRNDSLSTDGHDFQHPMFRHHGCPPLPEYCRNVKATGAIPTNQKSLKRGRVARGRRFSASQATRHNVHWLLRHSSCSNAEILHRAWRHRQARPSRKVAPLRDCETKAEFLSRWYPQWLTRIAAELDDILSTGERTPREKKKTSRGLRRQRAKAKSN